MTDKPPIYWCPPCQSHVEAKHTLSGVGPYHSPNTTCPQCGEDLIRDDDRERTARVYHCPHCRRELSAMSYRPTCTELMAFERLRCWECCIEDYELHQKRGKKALEIRNQRAKEAESTNTGGMMKTTVLPDGSAFTTASMALPKDHWIYGDPTVENDGFEPPPMPMRMGTDSPERKDMAEVIRKAARYAVRSSTMKGKDDDFDPDALVQNMVVGMLGYFTPDGLDHEDEWANPVKTMEGK